VAATHCGRVPQLRVERFEEFAPGVARQAAFLDKANLFTHRTGWTVLHAGLRVLGSAWDGSDVGWCSWITSEP
jgi:hypothetical protein